MHKGKRRIIRNLRGCKKVRIRIFQLLKKMGQPSQSRDRGPWDSPSSRTFTPNHHRKPNLYRSEGITWRMAELGGADIKAWPRELLCSRSRAWSLGVRDSSIQAVRLAATGMSTTSGVGGPGRSLPVGDISLPSAQWVAV